MNNNFNQFGMPINNLPMSGINPFGANGNTPYMAPTKPMEYDSVSFSNRQQLKPSFWDQTKMFFSQYGTKIFGWGATILGGLGAFALGKKFINLDVPYGKNAPKPSEDASLMAKAKYHLCTFLSDTVGVMKPYEAPAKTEEDGEADEKNINTIVNHLETLISGPTPDINTLKSTIDSLRNSLNGLKSSTDLVKKIEKLNDTVNKTTSLNDTITNHIKQDLEEIKTLLKPASSLPKNTNSLWGAPDPDKYCSYNSLIYNPSGGESKELREHLNLDDNSELTTDIIAKAKSLGKEIDNGEALEILRSSYSRKGENMDVSQHETLITNVILLTQTKISKGSFEDKQQNTTINNALNIFHDITTNINDKSTFNNLVTQIKTLLVIPNININNITKAGVLIEDIEEQCKTLRIDIQTEIDDVKNTANAQIVMLTDPKEVQKDTINAVEVDKLDAATKAKYLTKLPDIATNASDTDARNTANAQTVMLTDHKKVQKDTINAVDVTKLDATTKANYLTKLSNIAKNTSVKADVKNAAVNAKVNILNSIKEAEYPNTFKTAANLKNYLLSDDELKSLNNATKDNYVTKLSNIAKNPSVKADVKTAAVEAKVNIFKNLDVTSLTDTTKFDTYKLSKKELDLLTDKSEYVDKLSNIATNAKDLNVQNTANAQIAQIVIDTKNTDVTQKMINAVDVTKLNDTTSPTKAEYVKKLSDIAKKTTELEVKTTVFNALINQKDVKKQMINKNQLNITYKTLPLQYTFTLEKLSMPPADFSAYSKNTFILNGTQIYFKNHTKQYFKVTKFMIKT